MEKFWKSPGWEKSDYHLKKMQEHPFQREFPSIDTSVSPLFILRGPRQIGKTTWLKRLLSKSVREGHSCYFESCEDINDSRELLELLKHLKETNHSTIFLDEVTFVSGWWKAIKYAVESQYFDTLFITGSHTSDLRKGADRLPGRLPREAELTCLPMDFEEWLKMCKKAEHQFNSHVEALVTYFQIGGFPPALIEWLETKKFPKEALHTYSKWLIGDAIKLGKQELYLKEVLIKLAQVTATPVSLQTLAKQTQVGSHNTIQEYLALLEDCFALNTVYALDPNTGAIRFKKNKKFYFRDPLIYWMAYEFSGSKPGPHWQAGLAELVAAEALKRRYSRFGYYSSTKGEVDFYIKDRWALEIKWSESPTHNLSKAYKDIKTHKKTIWSQENFLKEWV